MSVNLGTQVAGQPLGLWLGAGAVGIGLAALWNRNRAAGIEQAAGDLDGEGAGGLLPPTGTARGPVILGAPGGIGTEQSPDTNAAWELRAIQGLISTGTDPVAADTAVRKYLQGLPMTAAEAAIIGKALTSFGPPPEGAAPIDVVTSPVLTPPAAPPSSPLPEGYEFLQNYAGSFVPVSTAPGLIPADNGIPGAVIEPGHKSGADLIGAPGSVLLDADKAKADGTYWWYQQFKPGERPYFV